MSAPTVALDLTADPAALTAALVDVASVSGEERALADAVEAALRAQAPPLEVLEETLIEVNRMTEMVDSLLMLARADEGRAPLHLERVTRRERLEPRAR